MHDGRYYHLNAIFLSIKSCCCCVVFLFFVLLMGCREFGNSGIGEGATALEIAGEDAYGKQVRLSDYHGKVVLLDFWATWCPPCVGEIPHEIALQQQFQGRPFTILGVSRDEKREELQSFLNHQRLPWPNILDSNAAIANQWGVGPIPTFILIDHTGTVVGKWVGGGQSEKIRAAVEQAVRQAEKK